jgi:putative endonuclease
MQYVYVLKSKKDGSLYVGCTNNIEKRIILHNSKKIKSTRSCASFVLIYYEAYIHSHDAFMKEKFLKTGWGRNQLQKILYNFLNPKSLGG